MTNNTGFNPRVLQAAAARAISRCNELAKFSDSSDGLTRVFCSDAMKKAHDQLKGWMTEAGMEYELDPVGNLIGCRASSTDSNDRPILMIGSHLDTVVNAGRFDGVLGILLGLGVAEALSESEIELPFDIHVVAFSEEEGVRFRFPFIGSRGMAGILAGEDLELKDADGTSMAEALEQFGCDAKRFLTSSYANRKLIGFLEAHIEQAIELQDAKLPVAVVAAIAGQSRAVIGFEGMSGHAGTVPHDRRRDALAAAAEFVLAVETLGQQTEGLFATIGTFDAVPGVSNVIAGRAEVRLDLRHKDDHVREQAYAKVETFINDISKRRGIDGAVISVQHTPAIPMDRELSNCLANAIAETNVNAIVESNVNATAETDAGDIAEANAGNAAETNKQTKATVSPTDVPMLTSGAGHDAMIMANIAPAAMLFVRCRDGISHHPDEAVSSDDIGVALDVMAKAVLKIDPSRS